MLCHVQSQNRSSPRVAEVEFNISDSLKLFQSGFFFLPQSDYKSNFAMGKPTRSINYNGHLGFKYLRLYVSKLDVFTP